MVFTTRNPEPLQLGRFYQQKPGIATSQPWLQLSIWVLIVLWHDQYIDCAVLWAVSPPAFRYVIWPTFLESRSKIREFWLYLVLFFTATQPISVRLQIWMLEVKEFIIQHNLRTDHVTVQSELTYLIEAKAVGIVNMELLSGFNHAKYPRFFVRARSQSAKTKAGQIFGWVSNWIQLNHRSKPRPLAGYPHPLLILVPTGIFLTVHTRLFVKINNLIHKLKYTSKDCY